ncbi:amino acid adenylation domain-containing protein [Pseudomonas sp. GD03858]|uniref:non-ribosomal peptide synthetase n=1 Tax=unclassified Pseudomonas TaxID=196821 RepID=UPI00244973F8|nr:MULTISPECIES: non-ribosomal peptide synthetase [unclassified Pseudomonas]MDH0645349.1 amino acid adenylation domain-containing protein [Pseudomonas sp. GD03867]MDH0660971.1 amino acid adenylation domain-containing protein [Pseudomonas sp. GD03858]
MQSIETLGQLKVAAAQRPKQASYWRELFKLDWSKTGFAVDKAANGEPRQSASRFTLRPEVAANVIKVTRGNEASQQVLLTSAVMALLHVYTRREVLVVGLPASFEARLAASQNLAFPLHASLEAGTSFKQLLDQVRSRVLGAMEHSDYPLELFAEEFSLPEAEGQSPFFDVAVEIAHPEKPSLAQRLNLAMLFSFTVTAEQVDLAIHFDARLYEATTLRWLAMHLEELLAQALQAPEAPLADLDLMTPQDVDFLATVNATEHAYDQNVRLETLFARQVSLRPDAVAVVSDHGEMTFAELDKRSNQLARTLVGRGVCRDQVVAVVAQRSNEMLVAILAVIKAGGAYLPIDPNYPQSRIDYVLDDSGARVILAQTHLLSASQERTQQLIDLDDASVYAADDQALPVAGDSRNLAYVIYTSGSTGQPKGVMVEHHSVVNRLAWMQRAYPIGPGDVILQKTPIAFDVSVWELFWWMIEGATVCLLAPGAERDPQAMVNTIEAYRVSTLHFVPSMLNAFLGYVQSTQASTRLASLRQVFASGEALSVHQVRLFETLLFDAHATALINLYGPTEATVDVSYFNCCGRNLSHLVPIGKPIDNTRLHILDANLKALPVGVPGELCIAGAGLARGYHQREALTAERFVERPTDAQGRIYRTGDLARWLPSGEIEYLGRIDNQVKLRGLRIELGEIETRLRDFPEVREAVVVVRQIGETQSLCGYIEAPQTLDLTHLRGFLGQFLPEYMVPTHLTVVDAFALSPSGKLDRKALPDPLLAKADDTEYVAPRNACEALLVTIWEDVLGVRPIGVHHNFFALGGDSIHFVTILGRARSQGLDFTFQDFFARPTIAKLVEGLTSGSVGEQARHTFEPYELLTQADRDRLPSSAEDAYPLSMLQAGLIFQNELSFGTAQYHDIISYTIKSAIDLAVFEQAVRILVQRNPIFRTSYHLSGYDQFIQMVNRDVELPLTMADLRGMDEHAQEQWYQQWLEDEKAHRFVWENAGLVRLHVHVLSDNLYRYVLSQHNSALDGWSITLVHTQLFEIYYSLLKGNAYDKPLVDNHLRNYMGLEQQSLASEADRQFWHKLMEGARFTQVPRLQPEAPTSGLSVVFHEVKIDSMLSERIIALADALHVPVKSVLMTAHLKVLSELAADDDVLVGYEHSGRPEVEGATRAIGLFLNTLPLRVKIAEGSWAQLIQQVYNAETDLLPHRRYPMAQIKQDMGTQQALFETAFNYTHFYLLKDLESLPEFDLLDVRANSETEFVLRAEFSRHFSTDDVRLSLHYHDHVFSAQYIEQMGSYYRQAFELMTLDMHARHDAIALPSPEQARLLNQARAIEAMTFSRASKPAITGQSGAPLTPESATERRIAQVWAEVLGVPVQSITVDDNFFELGGTSLAAIRVALVSDGLISIPNLMRHSTLKPLAEAIDEGAGNAQGLLQRLTPPCSDASVAVVCFPYAGGNAINFRDLGQVLVADGRERDIFAVELPGHDITRADEPLLDVREAAQRVARAIEQASPSVPLLFWGHCVGAALMLETARILEGLGRPISRVFVAGKLLDSAEVTRQRVAQTQALSHEQVLDWMVGETGYQELAQMSEQQSTTLIRAFRHDATVANLYLADAEQAWNAHRLAAPLTVVVTHDDSMTPDYSQRYQRWNLFSDDVSLHVIEDGGHYFCRTRPEAVAAVIIGAIQADTPRTAS